MKFAVICLLRGHPWHPWSYSGVRSRRYCPRCGTVIFTSKDMTK